MIVRTPHREEDGPSPDEGGGLSAISPSELSIFCSACGLEAVNAEYPGHLDCPSCGYHTLRFRDWPTDRTVGRTFEEAKQLHLPWSLK